MLSLTDTRLMCGVLRVKTCERTGVILFTTRCLVSCTYATLALDPGAQHY